MFVIGTRPEAIKLAPLIIKAREQDDLFSTRVIITGQHREMLDQMMRHFGIEADRDLAIMSSNRNLCDVTAAALRGIGESIREEHPDLVIVQGDTSTTLAGALAAFYSNVPVAHIEAGLRSFDKSHPWPEEVNRCLTTQLTTYHFAPTSRAKRNLLDEGISEDRIWVCGNTAIDALFMTLESRKHKPTVADESSASNRMILVTAHRRENHGQPLESICEAIIDILDRFADVEIVFPVHMSPAVRKTVESRLGNVDRVSLIDPLSYAEFVVAMNRSYLILTDSGGVQEEAPSLGKPVLVLREVTERPEAAEAGVAKIIGTKASDIIRETSLLLTDQDEYRRMSTAINPFGDGTASTQILRVLRAAGIGSAEADANSS